MLCLVSRAIRIVHAYVEARARRKGGGEKIRMVYLNRFLCVDAGMLAELIRLQCVECHMTSTLYRRDLCNHR